MNPISVSGQLLNATGHTRRFIDLPALFGDTLTRLPVVLRLLLENALLNLSGDERQAAIDGVLDWLERGTSLHEIAFYPLRVLMHDTTSTPALIDIAAMRDVLAEAGADPSQLNPVLPVDVSVDHSLAVQFHAQADAAQRNLSEEMRRNAERYRFLRWASGALDRVRIHPPGTGIMHTINLEQLATVASECEIDGQAWLVPDTLIGTDSHTPMVNGIGVLGWGVGGLEAQTVMFGMPVMQRIPDVIGVRLSGALPAGSTATDLALRVTEALRNLSVSGEFVEFYGTGVATLSANERAVVANMAPEYGASTGYFPVDARTLAYLRETGRDASHIANVETLYRRAGLWFDPYATPRYTRTIDIDLDSVERYVAGPFRPQDRLPSGATGRTLGTDPASRRGGLPDWPIALAAITSCTNTSDPALLITAGWVARRARARGLHVPSWVKTSLAPGSPAAADYLARAGLDHDLAALGFDIVGFGCTTCIGNAGPLPEPIARALADAAATPVAVVSGNRNFPGRIHPDLGHAFIMSPPLVVAFALAGTAAIDIENDPIQFDAHGLPVYLRDLWPACETVAASLAAVRADDFGTAFHNASGNPLWAGLDVSHAPRYAWSQRSTALRRPPFVARDEGSLLGDYDAHVLLALGDDVTTDHISPASAIPPDSPVADFLVERGEPRDDLNVFASRRGNWEVMVRAAFYSKSLVNLLAADLPVAHTVHGPSDDVMPIFDAAQRYREEGRPVVLVAGARYGTGSSRDWAAKGQRLLGIRAVVAVSFERIHRSNLIGMGILPLRLPTGVTPQTLALTAQDRVRIRALPTDVSPRAAIEIVITRGDGSTESLVTTAAVETRLEVELLQRGGVIPSILARALN
ncbi:aconitate hydratase [Pandoraea iniqua]|uniref:Aconitate hydratase A n=1 Tax=Pandoraea iniqua TaxID=2508288 RepID=A0A5E4UCJ3_9BURK|nr:aconitate hydratase AcnA [Pandoraea iniqua]VVD97776.1 aconitate hydratase [Pandoraea iniqua]